MKKSRFSETQIVAILAQQEKGHKVADICREHGISQATFYQWQRKYGGLEVNELKGSRNWKLNWHSSKGLWQILRSKTGY